MTEQHEADPQFVDFLAWQVASAERRSVLAAPIASTPTPTGRRGTRIMLTAALMILSTCLGAAGAYSVTQLDFGPERELNILRAELRLEQARTRLEGEAREVQVIEALHAAGAINIHEVAEARAAFMTTESLVQRRQLELDETNVTGKPARDDLTAPLVAGVDYVTQRMELSRRAVTSRLDGAAEYLERIEALADAAAVSTSEVTSARDALLSVEIEIVQIAERLDLRKRFLAGEISARAAELRAAAIDARDRRDAARNAVDAAKRVVRETKALYGNGTTTSSSLRRAENALREAEMQLRIAAVELDLIEHREAESNAKTDE